MASQPPATEQQFDIVKAGDPPQEVAVDGVVAVMVRRGVAKLDFYQFVGIDQTTRREQRRVHHRVSMPLASLEELAVILRRMSDAARQQQAAASGSQQAAASNTDGLRLIE